MKKEKILLFAISILLLIAPFLWSDLKSIRLGGDDTRIYYFSPLDWVKNISLFSWSSISSYPHYSPQIHSFPFFSFLSLFQLAGLPVYLIQKFTFGMVLFFSFLTIYLIIKEILSENCDRWEVTASAIIAGLLYISSPFLYLMEWDRPLFSLFGTVLFPLLLYFFIKAVKREKIVYLFYGALFSVFFSLALFSIPWMSAFLLGFIIYLLIHIILFPGRRRFIIYSVLLFLLILLFNLPFILSFLYGYIYKDPSLIGATTSPFRENASASVKYLSSHMSIVYTLSNLLTDRFYFTPDQPKIMNYMGKIIYANLFLLPIIIAGIFSLNKAKEKKVLLHFLSVMLILAFLITGNLGKGGADIYGWLMMNIPGFVMFRNFYSKFDIPFTLFYSITLGLGLYSTLSKLTSIRYKGIIILVVSIIVLLEGFPFLSGIISKKTLYPDAPYRINVQVPQYYKNTIEYIKNIKEDVKILSFPLTKPQYISFTDERGGLYIGASPIRPLTGKDDFSGLLSFDNPVFPQLRTLIEKSLGNSDNEMFKRIIGLLNIGYIVHNSDFPESVANYYMWSPGIFLDQTAIERWLQKEMGSQLISFGKITIYKLPRSYFLPHFYIPTSLKTEETTDDFIKNIENNLEGYKGIIIKEQNPGKKAMTIKNGIIPEISFERFNPTKYRLMIKGATKPFYIVFSEPFNTGWKVYIRDKKSFNLNSCEVVNTNYPSNNQIKCADNKSLDKFFPTFGKTVKESSHYLINGYANGWYIEPKQEDFEVMIDYWPQRLVMYGGIISIASILTAVFIFIGLKLKK